MERCLACEAEGEAKLTTGQVFRLPALLNVCNLCIASEATLHETVNPV